MAYYCGGTLEAIKGTTSCQANATPFDMNPTWGFVSSLVHWAFCQTDGSSVLLIKCLRVRLTRVLWVQRGSSCAPMNPKPQSRSTLWGELCRWLFLTRYDRATRNDDHSWMIGWFIGAQLFQSMEIAMSASAVFKWPKCVSIVVTHRIRRINTPLVGWYETRQKYCTVIISICFGKSDVPLLPRESLLFPSMP